MKTYQELQTLANAAMEAFNSTLYAECKARNIHVKTSGQDVTLQGDACATYEALRLATAAANTVIGGGQ